MNEQIVKYVRVIFSRAWLLLVLAIAGAGAAYFSGDTIFQKEYEAKMKIIITLQDAAASNVNVYDSLRSSQMAVGDVSQIIASDAVLLNAEKECGIDRGTIGRAIKIDTVPNTRIMDISARMNTPQRALNLVESLDKNLSGSLVEIDKSIAYKVLSKPAASAIPVNGYEPLAFVIAAAFGGVLIGSLINLLIGDRHMTAGGLDYIQTLFEEENILLVPASKIPNQEGSSV